MSAQLLQGQARRDVVGKPHLVHAPSDRQPLRVVGDGFGLQVEQSGRPGQWSAMGVIPHTVFAHP